MKKIIIHMCLIASIFADNISLTGEYADLNGNPFKKVLNIKKDYSMNVFSENSKITFKVTSNLNKDSYILIPIQEHEKEYILNNKSVENISASFYTEDYKVNKTNQGDFIEVNILSGKINLEYLLAEESEITYLEKVTINMNLEIIKHINNKATKTTRSITMDNTLGKTGDNYDWAITTDKDYSSIDLMNSIHEILETEIYSVLKGI
ncbi:MAG: hypothetical protein K8R44_03630 [Sulfurimonas sp.]|nr:hypothetical protein [Sulfurimonas sp.]